jgi:predicted small lipoprotein YifL
MHQPIAGIKGAQWHVIVNLWGEEPPTNSRKRENQMNKLTSIILGGLVLGSLAGCGNQGPAERAGENVDEAVEEMKDEVDDATDAR